MMKKETFMKENAFKKRKMGQGSKYLKMGIFMMECGKMEK